MQLITKLLACLAVASVMGAATAIVGFAVVPTIAAGTSTVLIATLILAY